MYRFFVELWIYLGLAWLSLFINWKVSMFVAVHRALKKRRKRRRESLKDQHHHHKSKTALSTAKTTATNTTSNTTTGDINIFNFLSKKQVSYNDLIKQIGTTNGTAVRSGSTHNNKILSFERSPRLKRSHSQGDMEMYSMNKGFMYDRPSILQAMSEKEELELEIFENQLDKDERENGGRWDPKGYQSFIFQNANITFIDEENLMEAESKEKFSLDDNVES
ncbi:KCNK5 protein, partial [Polyodon spathula]|nr:KCNK5 protein [Polyodon spathula]